MRDLVSQFFSGLHISHLKPRRYKKVRRTFSREMDGYAERVQFQGSSWNNAGKPWRFYINFGVEFPDLRARSPCRDFPATHYWTRIENIVPDAPKEYDLPKGSQSEFAEAIAGYLDCASRQVSSHIIWIRRDYEIKRSPWFKTI